MLRTSRGQHTNKCICPPTLKTFTLTSFVLARIKDVFMQLTFIDYIIKKLMSQGEILIAKQRASDTLPHTLN